MWTRNDDMRHGRMRPASHHKVRATHLLGNVLTYEHRHATLPVDFSHGLGEALTARRVRALLSGGTTQTVFQLEPERPVRLRRRDAAADRRARSRSRPARGARSTRARPRS